MKNFSWSLLGVRILFLSILGILLSNFGVFNKIFLDYFIILLCVTFIFFGIDFLIFKKEKNRSASNILATSLILAGLSFAFIWTLIRIYDFPLNNNFVTGFAIIFMFSVLGTLFGGLAYK